MPEPSEQPPAAAPPGPPPGPPPAPLARRLLRPRARRVDLAVAGLLLVLGFAFAVQVRSTNNEGPLTNARPEDLVQILDELDNRGERLGQEIASLADTQRALSSGSGDSAAALAEAQRRTQLLGIVAGTLPATGPGVTVRITDPEAKVSAAVLLDALEELRNAGAEAVQLEGTSATGSLAAVRVVAQTSFVDSAQGIVVDDTALLAPYRFVVIGEPATLAGAMAIPGGIEDAVRQQGGAVQVDRRERVRVGALRVFTPPRYARPS